MFTACCVHMTAQRSNLLRRRSHRIHWCWLRSLRDTKDQMEEQLIKFRIGMPLAILLRRNRRYNLVAIALERQDCSCDGAGVREV